MLVVYESKKEVVKEIIKHTKGGRGALAGAIGISNNKLYERNGCLFFDDEDLEAMEIHAGTYCLAQYRASLRGGLFIPLGDFEIDQEELSEIQIGEMAAIGDVNVIISKALDDGEIDENEAKQIRKAAISAAAQFITSKLATIRVYRAR